MANWEDFPWVELYSGFYLHTELIHLQTELRLFHLLSFRPWIPPFWSMGVSWGIVSGTTMLDDKSLAI